MRQLNIALPGTTDSIEDSTDSQICPPYFRRRYKVSNYETPAWQDDIIVTRGTVDEHE